MKLRLLTTACLAALCLCLPAAAAGEDPAGTAPPAEVETLTAHCQAELFQAGSLTGDYTRPGPALLDDGVEGEMYALIYAALEGEKDQVDLSGLGIRLETVLTPEGKPAIDSNCEGARLLKQVYSRVVNDHPELFYVVNGYRYSASGYGDSFFLTTVTPQYDRELMDEREDFDQRVETIVAMTDGMDALEKALFFHDWLATENHYAPDSVRVPECNDKGEFLGLKYPNYCHSAYGALMKGEAVCQGYALAYKLLLDEAEVECTAVTSDQLNHMWNAVSFDGNRWYYVDVTWDDPTEDKLERCTHNNFLVSETGIRATGHDSTDWTFDPENDGDTQYESGWAFNGGADTPFHRWNGVWYHVANRTRVGEDGAIRVLGSDLYAHESLEDEGRLVAEFGRDGVYTAAWEGGWAYCLGYFDGKLLQVELATGEIRTVADLDSDSREKGLYYDRAKGEIQVWTDLDKSTGARSMLHAFPVKEYPPAWDEMPGNATALAGAAWNEGDLQIGLVWAEGAGTPAPWLAAAFYDAEGRLTALRVVSTEGLEAGLNVLELTGDRLPGDHARAALFLLAGDGTLTPLEEKLPLSGG